MIDGFKKRLMQSIQEDMLVDWQWMLVLGIAIILPGRHTSRGLIWSGCPVWAEAFCRP